MSHQAEVPLVLYAPARQNRNVIQGRPLRKDCGATLDQQVRCGVQGARVERAPVQGHKSFLGLGFVLYLLKELLERRVL